MGEQWWLSHMRRKFKSWNANQSLRLFTTRRLEYLLIATLLLVDINPLSGSFTLWLLKYFSSLACLLPPLYSSARITGFSSLSTWLLSHPNLSMAKSLTPPS